MYRTYRDLETGGFMTKKDGGATLRFQNARIIKPRFVVDVHMRDVAVQTGIRSHHAYIESDEMPLFRVEPGEIDPQEIVYSFKDGVFYTKFADDSEPYVVTVADVIELQGGRVFLARMD